MEVLIRLSSQIEEIKNHLPVFVSLPSRNLSVDKISEVVTNRRLLFLSGDKVGQVKKVSIINHYYDLNDCFSFAALHLIEKVMTSVLLTFSQLGFLYRFCLKYS